ncbi:hypothetical protein FOZ63_030766 [Perkinsus olseni]|uniref:Uncharacterized protein n=1 Tax=Perkinsus olseni TaxID=32597 RepID=A0A7J6TTU9_PEROL|nr:hypothetical protein FOZ63_030766 [Perkinsus olseni]
MRWLSNEAVSWATPSPRSYCSPSSLSMLLLCDPAAAILSYFTYWAVYGALSRHRRGREREKSLCVTQLVYSIQTIIIGCKCIFEGWDELWTNAAFGYNPELPLVEVHLNLSIGFVLYNLHHSLTWYRKGLLHDLILLFSLVLSDILEYYGLAMVVSSIIASLGSAAYLLYIRKDTTRGHLEFIICFGFSRLLLLFWTLFVVYKAFDPPRTHWRVIGVWSPPCVVAMQLLVFWAEIDSWASQCRKFRREQWRRYRTSMRNMRKKMEEEAPLKTPFFVTIKAREKWGLAGLASSSPRRVGRVKFES